MGSLIRGIHHVALKCGGTEAFEKTISFYQNVLGLEVLRRWGQGMDAGAMLSTGNGLLEIFASGEPLPQGVIRHFALATDRVDDCVAAVRAAGYPITVAPKDVVIQSQPPFPIRIAFCTGPMGEEIEFFPER